MDLEVDVFGFTGATFTRETARFPFALIFSHSEDRSSLMKIIFAENGAYPDHLVA
jgi:hypothetical protein